jgi:hypothetical protein
MNAIDILFDRALYPLESGDALRLIANGVSATRS